MYVSGKLRNCTIIKWPLKYVNIKYKTTCNSFVVKKHYCVWSCRKAANFDHKMSVEISQIAKFIMLFCKDFSQGKLTKLRPVLF